MAKAIGIAAHGELLLDSKEAAYRDEAKALAEKQTSFI